MGKCDIPNFLTNLFSNSMHRTYYYNFLDTFCTYINRIISGIENENYDTETLYYIALIGLLASVQEPLEYFIEYLDTFLTRNRLLVYNIRYCYIYNNNVYCKNNLIKLLFRMFILNINTITLEQIIWFFNKLAETKHLIVYAKKFIVKILIHIVDIDLAEQIYKIYQDEISTFFLLKRINIPANLYRNYYIIITSINYMIYIINIFI